MSRRREKQNKKEKKKDFGHKRLREVGGIRKIIGIKRQKKEMQGTNHF